VEHFWGKKVWETLLQKTVRQAEEIVQNKYNAVQQRKHANCYA